MYSYIFRLVKISVKVKVGVVLLTCFYIQVHQRFILLSEGCESFLFTSANDVFLPICQKNYIKSYRRI